MMILSLIINFFALIGVLTTGLIALALWAYYSDEETYEHYPLIDPFEDMEKSIPSADKEGRN